MAWILLFGAGLLEIVWTLGLKYTQGFTKLVPSLITGSAMVLSMFLLAKAAKTLPLGTAYAIWVGVGVVGAAIGGSILFHEVMPPLKIACLVLLVIAIAGIKLTSVVS